MTEKVDSYLSEFNLWFTDWVGDLESHVEPVMRTSVVTKGVNEQVKPRVYIASREAFLGLVRSRQQTHTD